MVYGCINVKIKLNVCILFLSFLNTNLLVWFPVIMLVAFKFCCLLFQRQLNFSTAPVQSDKSDTTVHVEDTLLTEPGAESTCTEPGIECLVENYDSAGDSVLHTSVMLHDYCGAIDRGTLSTHINKCEQTDPTEGIEPLCAKTFADASVQCSVKVTSTLVQTGNLHAKAPIETCTAGIQTSQ